MKSAHRRTARAKLEIDRAMSEAQFTEPPSESTHHDDVAMDCDFDDTIFFGE